MKVTLDYIDNAALWEKFHQKTLVDTLIFARGFLVVGLCLVLLFHYWDELVDITTADTALILRSVICSYGLIVLGLSFWSKFFRIHNFVFSSTLILTSTIITVIACIDKSGLETGVGATMLVLLYSFLFGAHTGLRAPWMAAVSFYQIVIYDIGALLYSMNEAEILANNICMISLLIIGLYFYFSVTRKTFQRYLLAAQLNDRNVDIQSALNTINMDLEIASKLQRAILPQFFPSNSMLSGAAIMDAAKHIGGDFYDFFEISENKYCVVIADVAGKGIPAALFMAISRTILRSQAVFEGGAPARTIYSTNNQLCQLNPLDLFVTVFFGIVDTSNGTLCYCCAGHPPPFIVRRDKGSISRLKTNDDIALGVLEQMSFTEETASLNPGDSIILFTDGLSEAMNERSEQYTEERMHRALEDVIERDVANQLDALMSGIREFVGSAIQSDDLTCLILRYNGKVSDISISGSHGTSTEIGALRGK